MRGYPIDRRLKRQQETLAGVFECMAARVVARLTGEQVVLQDDNSQPRMVDIRIDYTNRPAGYVEVTVDLDEPYAETYQGIFTRDNKIPEEIPAPQLGRIWHVTVSNSSRLKRLRQELLPLLEMMQTAGEMFEVVTGDERLKGGTSPNVARLLDLGVVEVASRSVRDGEQGVVLLWPQGTGGSIVVSWQCFLSWIEQTLSSSRLADVRCKLARTGAAERHVFLGVSYSTPWGVFFALSEEHSSLPPEPPQLPDEITHLWVMNAQSPGRCLAWFPDRGWVDTRRYWVTD